MVFRLDWDINARDRSKFGFGYDCLMSKRSTVYADMGVAL